MWEKSILTIELHNFTEQTLHCLSKLSGGPKFLEDWSLWIIFPKRVGLTWKKWSYLCREVNVISNTILHSVAIVGLESVPCCSQLYMSRH